MPRPGPSPAPRCGRSGGPGPARWYRSGRRAHGPGATVWAGGSPAAAGTFDGPDGPATGGRDDGAGGQVQRAVGAPRHPHAARPRRPARGPGTGRRARPPRRADPPGAVPVRRSGRGRARSDPGHPRRRRARRGLQLAGRPPPAGGPGPARPGVRGGPRRRAPQVPGAGHVRPGGVPSPTTPSAPTVRRPPDRPRWRCGAGSWPGWTWWPPRATRWPRSAPGCSGCRPTR